MGQADRGDSRQIARLATMRCSRRRYHTDSAGEAREVFWPAYRDAFGRIGRERGWPAPTREQFDAQCDPVGALLVGDAATAVDKILREHEWLGGLDRLTVLLDNRVLTHRQIMRAIELLGTEVAPAVRKATVPTVKA